MTGSLIRAIETKSSNVIACFCCARTGDNASARVAANKHVLVAFFIGDLAAPALVRIDLFSNFIASLLRGFASGERMQNLAEQVRLCGVALQMGIALASMVLNFVGAHEAAVVGCDHDRFVVALRCKDGIVQCAGRESAAIHREQTHAGRKSGVGGGRAGDYIGQVAVVLAASRMNDDAQRKAQESTCPSTLSLARMRWFGVSL